MTTKKNTQQKLFKSNENYRSRDNYEIIKLALIAIKIDHSVIF